MTVVLACIDSISIIVSPRNRENQLPELGLAYENKLMKQLQTRLAHFPSVSGDQSIQHMQFASVSYANHVSHSREKETDRESERERERSAISACRWVIETFEL